MQILSDPSAERAVLSIICRHGEQSYLEIADILSEQSFIVDSNIIIWKCLQKVFSGETTTNSIDVATIYSAAKELNLDHILDKKEEVQHLKAILDFPVKQDNLRKFAAKIKKLEIARKLIGKVKEIEDELLEVDGSESITEIIGIAEDPILNFGSSLEDGDNNPTAVGDIIEDHIQFLKENKVEQVGISTGFPVYDFAIGGGLRPGTINVIGARPKTGKTILADNMGVHIAKMGIPVLNMDTEMTEQDHINRVVAMMTEVSINTIETGKFVESPDMERKIDEAAKELKGIPLSYKPIPGKPFEEQLAIMRRWIIKKVGFNPDGSTKPCVIIYDYLKLMDSSGISQDLKEYQMLGFMMTKLHNFARKYNVPIIAFVQLNRDGISKDSTDTVSQSDRIIWLCSNFTVFKRKTDEEIAEDGPTNGNRKLLPVIARHGGGLEDNDYINCHMKGWCAKVIEGKTRFETVKNNGSDDGFNISEENQDIPFD